MLNIKRCLSILLALMILVSVVAFTTFNAYSADEAQVGVGPGVDDGGGEVSPEVDPEPINPEPVDPEPVDPEPVDPDPVDPEPVDEDPVDDGGYVDDNPGYVDDGDSNQEFYYYDEDEMVKNADANIDEIQETKKLYEISDIDDKALKKNKWDDINIEIGKKSNVEDFSAIKENKEVDDNYQWVLYVGIVLISLALLGIIYFIIATVVNKKRLDKLRKREQKNIDRRRKDKVVVDEDGYVDIDALNRYEQRTQRRYAEKPKKAHDKRALKGDTAEIYLPKRYAKK